MSRAKLLRFNPFREKTVEVNLPQEDGTSETIKVLIRQPSVAARDKILAEMLDDKGQMKGGSSLSRRQAVTVIQCCLDPETRAPMFQDTDAEALAALPSGSWLDTLAAEATELMSAGQEAVTKSPPG
jgi:hypothetical protein